MIKRGGLLFIALIMTVSFMGLFTGCGRSAPSNTELTATEGQSGQPEDVRQASSEPSVRTKKRNIALVMKTLTNPFFIEMEKGARKAENEFGINLTVKTGAKETSIDQQIAIVEEFISSKADAIVIAPGSSTDLVPVLKKAQDAGIIIVNIDNRLDPAFMQKSGLTGVPYISVDNEAGAYKSAKYISDMIKSPAKAAILEGIRGADNAEQRKKGALRAFAENRNIQLVASETANWKIDEAHDVASSIFSKNPDIRAIFCANDMMALGVIQYLNEAGRKDVLVAGFDALNEAQSAIEKGDMQVTINQQADVQGYLGVKYAFEMLQGRKEPSETMVDVKPVTKQK